MMGWWMMGSRFDDWDLFFVSVYLTMFSIAFGYAAALSEPWLSGVMGVLYGGAVASCVKDAWRAS